MIRRTEFTPFWWTPGKARWIGSIRRCPNVRKKRKTCAREFKPRAVRLIAEKGDGIAETSRNLGVEYSVLRRWNEQLADDPQNAFPGKGSQRGNIPGRDESPCLAAGLPFCL
ncbi:MAG: hypothetical protein DSY90_09380 [Deltaproteobacteria bacterium]|nr:MAG: hypothetical protein DSY90_09380 [Deltaproteobacteria bacterium]